MSKFSDGPSPLAFLLTSAIVLLLGFGVFNSFKQAPSSPVDSIYNPPSDSPRTLSTDMPPGYGEVQVGVGGGPQNPTPDPCTNK